ncbi:MAG: DUF934 domain-containing protein [Rhodospirillales bacterium]
MPVIKDGRIGADPYVDLADGEPLPGEGPVIVSLARWRAERATLLARGGHIGVRLASNEPATDLADAVGVLALIALEFPTFRDGRAYSTARLLRERYRFGGELRAVGNVLRDQYLFMQRCGFDAFEVKDEDAVAAWQQAINEFSVFYQPTGDGRLTAPLARRLARAAE